MGLWEPVAAWSVYGFAVVSLLSLVDGSPFSPVTGPTLPTATKTWLRRTEASWGAS